MHKFTSRGVHLNEPTYPTENARAMILGIIALFTSIAYQ